MTIDRAHRAINGVVCALVWSAAIAGLFGCASIWQSAKSTAAPAMGGAAGAFIGSAAGPVGTIVGAGVGAALGDSIEENASFRAGETVGEGAVEKELRRWKGEAIAATSAADELKRLGIYALIGVAGWFAFRNRHNIKDLGLVKGTIHALFGGKVGKKHGT